MSKQNEKWLKVVGIIGLLCTVIIALVQCNPLLK